MEGVKMGGNNLQVPEHGLQRVHCLPSNAPSKEFWGQLLGFFLIEEVLVLMNEPSGFVRNHNFFKPEKMLIPELPPLFLDLPPVSTYIKIMKASYCMKRIAPEHPFQVGENPPKVQRVKFYIYTLTQVIVQRKYVLGHF